MRFLVGVMEYYCMPEGSMHYVEVRAKKRKAVKEIVEAAVKKKKDVKEL